MLNYRVYILGLDDPQNDEFNRIVEMTEEQAHALRKRLLAAAEGDLIYDDYYVSEVVLNAHDDVTTWLDELEAACG